MVAYKFFACMMALALFSILFIGLGYGINQVGDAFNNNMVNDPSIPVSQQTVDTTSGLITFFNASPVFVILTVFIFGIVAALQKRTGGE